jgi:hypothetical protein
MRGRRVLGFVLTVVLAWAGAGSAAAQSPEDALEAVGQVGHAVRQLPFGLSRGVTGPLEPAFTALAGDGCDPTDPLRCLLPFPNDRFTTVDATTPTGLRVDLSLAAMPRNVAGKPIDPTEWNRNDGFSPGSMLLTHVPDLDLARTFDLPDGLEAPIEFPSRSVAQDAPIVLLDAETGERHPHWAELDTHPDTTDDVRLLIVRPLRNLEPGHRYVVALRDLRDGDGQPLEAGPTFAALRDGLPPTACPPAADEDEVEGGSNRPPHAGQPGRPPHAGQPGPPPHAGGPDRSEGGDATGPDASCPDDLPGEEGRYQRLFGDLTAAGIEVDELFLAWDFTVASSENLTGRSLAIRDQTFAALGDEDLTDGHVAGAAPDYTITEVEQRPDDLAIRGTITAPNFLTLPQDLPRLPPRELGTGVEQYLPGSRLFYGEPFPDPMATPTVNPLSPTVDADFVCHLPNRASADDPALPTLYGHGLLGGIGEAGGGSTSLLRASGHLVCATPWVGMATEDVANVATILTDVSNFATLPDRSQQGFLHFHLLGRLMIHPDGFAADPAFQDDEGRPRLDPSEVVYDGNSQGGILGGSLVALAPDVRKASLGVPGATTRRCSTARSTGRAPTARCCTPPTPTRPTSS